MGSSVVAAIVLSASSGCAALSGPLEPSYASVRSLIETEHLASLGSVLARLPETYRSHYVLLFESRSPQRATFRDPRAILYGQSAAFVIAFNGNATQGGFRSLDTMELDRARGRYVFREIVLPERATGGLASFSEEDPPSCTVCHGNPPRPIWDTYPLWPGAYGQRAGAALSQPERLGLAAFEGSRGGNDRYTWLGGRSSSSAAATARAYDGFDGRLPAAELGLLLSRWSTDAVITDVVRSPRFVEYRFALAAAFAPACAALDPLPESIEGALLEPYARYASGAAESLARHEENKMLRAEPAPAAPPSALPLASGMARFRYITEQAMELGAEPWSLAFERGSFESPPPGFAALFVARASERDPSLRVLFEMARQGDCRELQRRGARALRSLPPSPSVLAGGEPRSDRDDRPLAALLATCGGCHYRGSAGRYLAIVEATQWQVASRRTGYPHGSLLDEIDYRLRPEAGAQRMPMGIDLSRGEIATLRAYFHAAKGSSPGR